MLFYQNPPGETLEFLYALHTLRVSDERLTESMIDAHLRGPTAICMFLMRLPFTLLAPEFAALFARIVTAFGPSRIWTTTGGLLQIGAFAARAFSLDNHFVKRDTTERLRN